MKNTILTCIGLAFICAACTDDKLMADFSEQPINYVTAKLTVGIEDEIAATSEAKSRALNVDDPEDNIRNTEIIDLLVVQYNGISDDAVVLGQPQFFSRGNEFNSNEELQNLTVKLAGADGPSTMVVIANVGDKLLVTNNTTLGDLKARHRIADNEASLFAKTSDDKYHIMLNCVKVLQSIGSGSEIECRLKHNLARINLCLKVKKNLNMTINDAVVGNVSKICHYVNSYDDFSIVTASNEVFDFNPDIPTSTAEGDYNNFNFTFYVTPNLRGTTESVSEQGKNLTAPGGSTYVTMNAKFAGNEDKDEEIYEYTFYLGENLINNFDLKPNHSYDYTLKFDAKGDPDIDSRVEDMSLVNFTTWERANCYILNPAHLYDRTFRIPVDRVDVFWGDNGYEYTDNYCLKSDAKWKVEVIWTDFDNSDGIFKIKKGEGVGKNDSFEVEIGKSCPPGNALVGIRRTDIDDNSILWSWHLWITDYNPYKAVNMDVIEGVFEYDVIGGFVHRYGSDAWKTGVYSNTFIMDRDLGSIPDPNLYSYNVSKLGFQFGRKDPLSINCVLYDANNQTIPLQIGVPGVDKVKGTVHNPINLISGGNWTEEEKYNIGGNYNVWKDPILSKNYSNKITDKSLFDPSPSGWRVPPSNSVWDTNAASNNFGANYFGFEDPIVLGNKAVYSYWPSGYTPMSGHITFIASSIRQFNTVPMQSSLWRIGINSGATLSLANNGTGGGFNAAAFQGQVAFVRPVMMRAPK